MPSFRESGHERASVELTDIALADADAVVIITDHTVLDYQRVVDVATAVVDTRNATAGLRRRQPRDPAGKSVAGLAIA